MPRATLSRAGLVVVAAMWAGVPLSASAEDGCDAIVARLTGSQTDGEGTLDLERKAQLGNCTAAAQLVRRATNAQGYAKVHCPAAVEDMATGVLKLGREALGTPECQG